MLQLTANNQTLDIKEASFNLTLRSPVSSDSAGSFVFSVTIPYSETNARIFSFPFRLERFQRQTASKEGFIIYKGVYIQEGIWQAKTSNRQSIELEMLIGGGYFNNLIEGKILNQFFDVALSYPDIVGHVNAQVLKTWPEVNHNFPTIYNPKLYGDKNENFAGIINNFEGSFIQSGSNNNTIIPQLYLLYMLKQLFGFVGYSVSGNVLDDEMFKRALIYSNFALDKLRSTWLYAEITNSFTSSFILWDENIQDPGTHYNATTGAYTLTGVGNYKINLYLNHTLDPPQGYNPDYYRVEIWLDGTRIKLWELPHELPGNQHQDTLSFDYLISAADINKKFYIKLYYIDSLYPGNYFVANILNGNCTIRNIDALEINEYETEINYKNHVPAIAVKDFLTAFYDSAKILPFFNHQNKSVELVFLRDLIASNKKQALPEGLLKDSLKIYANTYEGFAYKFDFQGPDDFLNNNFRTAESGIEEVLAWVNLPFTSPGVKCFVKTLNASFILRYDEQTLIYTWEPYNDYHAEHTVEQGKEKNPTKLAPMLMRNLRNSFLQDRSLPAISGEGTAIAFGLENDCPLRIMFYVGMEYPGTGNAYPLATTTKYSTNGTLILPINWKAEDIIERYFSELLKWYARREALEFEQLVSPAFIKSFDFQTLYNFQKTLALFEEVVVKISNKSFGPAEFKGWG